MTFSFHGSLRGIPQPLREVAAIQRLSTWQTFKLLEVPASMIGLVWNSMMSMAGGWFFLTVNEAFTLKGRDYRLPGIGSYMNEAILHFDPKVLASWGPIFGAIVAMVIMIVAVDQIFWRPIVVWSQRFRMDDIAQSEVSQSWMLDLLQKSRLYSRLGKLFARKRVAEVPEVIPLQAPPMEQTPPTPGASLEDEPSSTTTPSKSEAARPGIAIAPILNWLVLAVLLIGAVWGGWALIKLLLGLPLWDSAAAKAGRPITEHEDWLAVFLALMASFLRTTTAVVLGAAWALPVGILIGRSHKWSSRLQPIIQVVASFPAPMLFPLVTMALVVLHIPFTTGCIALMLLGAQWYILFNVIAGASAIPHDLDEVGSVYQMSRWECWKRLYLPCTFPYLLTGLVTAAGGAWNATIVSEYVQLGDKPEDRYVAFGLGSTISNATNEGNFSLLAAGVVMMAVFVVLINRLFWKRLYRLAEDRYSLNV
jgi:NitT/TauT family transport system permease protein